MANYPAPVLAADRPIGVTAPGDAFVLPSTITGGSTKGAVVSEWHREVSAGEKFGLTGLGLAGASFPMFMGGKFYSTATAGDSQTAEVLLPNYGQTWDFALAWVAASDGISLPIALNITRVLWVQKVWAPGLTINFYGENLAHGNVEGGAAYVAVQRVGSDTATVYPTTAANCHRVPFTVPDLAPGDYDTWGHNGHGGNFGWSRRHRVTVVANSAHIKTRDFGPATLVTFSPTDAAANDALLATYYVDGCNIKANPIAGGYPISRTGVVPSFSRIASTDPEQTLQFTITAGTTWPNPEDRGMFGTNSATMVLMERTEFLNPNNVNLNNNASMGREVALLSFNNVNMLWLKGVKAEWSAPYTEFQTGPVKAAEPYGCFRIKTSQNIFIDDCTMTGSGNPFIQCSDVYMTNYNMVGKHQADHQLYGLNTKRWSVIGGNVRQYNAASKDGKDRTIRVFKCGGQGGTNGHHYFENIVGVDLGIVYGGANPIPDTNQLEQDLYEGNTAEFGSMATASTATTVTLAQKLTYTDQNSNPRNYATQDYHLVIIAAGRGMGQTRGIVSSSDYTITVDEPWNVLPDSTSLIETGTFAREVIFYNVDYTATTETATNPTYTHAASFNGFGGIRGFIRNKCRGANFRQGFSIISTQNADSETLIDQSAFNVVKNSTFPSCRWGARVESNPPVPTWKPTATGVLCNLFQNNTFPNPILSPLVFQLPRNASNISVAAVNGLFLNKQAVVTNPANDYTPTFVDDPDYPPVAPLAQALKNFTQAIAQSIVSQVTIYGPGQYPFSYLGTTPLNLSGQAWYTTQNVVKIQAVGANHNSYVSGQPGSSFGVTQLVPAANAGDPLPGYVLVLKQPITVDGTLFGGLPTGAVVPATPAAPTNLRQTASTSSTLTLAWDGVAGTQTLQRATVTNGTVGAYSPVYSNTAKTYQDGPLAFGASYAYRVKVTVNGVDSPYSNVLQYMATSGGQLASPANLRQTGSTTSSNTLAWDAVTGADGYQLLRGSTPVYTGSARAYADTGLSAGTGYGYTVQATDSTGTKQASAFSPTFTATTAGTTANTLTAITADYAQNGGLSSASAQPGRNSSLSGSRAALSVLAYSTTDPQPTIAVASGMAGFGNDYVAVFNGLSLVGTYQAGTSQLPALAGSAPYALTIVNGAQQRSYEQGAIRGTELVSLTAAAGYSLSKVPPARSSRLVIWFGDSISNGAGSSNPQVASAAARLRQRGIDVALYGYGSAQGYVMTDPANRAAVQAFVQAASVGYAASAITLLLTTGTNDYHGGQGGAGSATPSDLAARYADFAAFLAQLLPAASLATLTPLTRTDTEAANSLGFTLPQYRAAIKAAIPDAYDGAGIVSTANISSDGVHPIDAGHLELANWAETTTLRWAYTQFVSSAGITQPSDFSQVQQVTAAPGGDYFTNTSNGTKKGSAGDAAQRFVTDFEFTVLAPTYLHVFGVGQPPVGSDAEIEVRLYAESGGRVRIWNNISGNNNNKVYDGTPGVAANDVFLFRVYTDEVRILQNGTLLFSVVRPVGDTREFHPSIAFGNLSGGDALSVRQRGVNLTPA